MIFYFSEAYRPSCGTFVASTILPPLTRGFVRGYPPVGASPADSKGGTHYHMTHRPKCAFVFVLLVSYTLSPYLLEICSLSSGPLVFKVGISLITCREEAGADKRRFFWFRLP